MVLSLFYQRLFWSAQRRHQQQILRRFASQDDREHHMRSIIRSIVLAIAFATPVTAQQQSSAFSVGSAKAQRGTSATGVIAVPAGSDSALDIPVAVIHGA